MTKVLTIASVRPALAVAALLTAACAAVSHAAIPEPGTPLAAGQHPRLFVTADQLPALRERIQEHYSEEFQAFINLLNNPRSLTSSQRAVEAYWGSLNYAFLALLDPAEMEARGFTFASDLDTAAEYCERAMTYVRPQLQLVTSHKNQSHDDLTTGYPKPIYFPIAAAYDWCYGQIGSPDRTAIVDAFVSVYRDWYEGKNLQTMEVYSDMLANNQASALTHNALGILAFYGDPYPSTQTQKRMYEVYDALWLTRTLGELNTLYEWGTNWHEGPTNYFADSFLNIALPLAMAAPALGRNIIGTTPFFYLHPAYAVANVRPLNMLQTCGPSGKDLCPPIMERWGTVGDTLGLHCRVQQLSAGLLRHVNHPNAGLARWVHERTMQHSGCEARLRDHGGAWANDVLYRFLYGDREVAPQSPASINLAKSQKLGLGQYVFRSGYEGDASQVVFWAPQQRTYGHDSPEFGSFTLHKFGNLIVKPSNCKSGDAVLKSCQFNLMTNAVGIHWGASNTSLAFNGFTKVDPVFGDRGITSIRVAGTVLAEAVGRGLFDYVSYDASPAWRPSTASLSQREFVYLNGPTNSEYLVVFDRVQTPNPTVDEKVWKIWVPTEPRFENGSPSPITRDGGMRTATDATMVSVTNKVTSVATKYFSSPPTHGKFYLKSLWPAKVTINVIGGSGKEFQGADNNGDTPWGAPVMTNGMREYLGWGRIEVRPSTSQAYDTLLHVVQFGDANTLTSPAPIERIASTDGAMMGSHVRDPRNEWVVMFGTARVDPGAGLTSIQYAFPRVAATSRHLVANLSPGRTFFVAASGSAAATTVTVSTTPSQNGVPITASVGGAVAFALSGNQVTPLSTAPPTKPSDGVLQAPRNVRVIQ